MAFGTKIGTAFFEVDADTSKAEAAVRNFGSEVDSSSSRAASGFGKISDAAKLAAGVVVGFVADRALSAIVGFASESIQAFSDLEQSVGGTEAVFGAASDEIDSFARTSAQSIGLAESEFRTATTLIGGQLKRMTGDVDFAADSAIALTQVGADLAATYGGTTKEAVDAFAAALRGEADPAERFNLNLKQGVVNAKAVELGLADTTSEVDENAKAQALLALVTEQSADAQGQFAREMDTVAGSTAIANAELENAQARLGAALAPAKNLGNELKLLGSEALGNVSLFLQRVTGQINDAEFDIAEFAIETGRTAETMDDFLQLADVGGRNLVELADAFTFAAGELRPLTDEQRNLLTEMGFTTEEVEALDAALREKLVIAEREATVAAGEAYLAMLNQRAGTEEVTGATEDATAAVEANIEALEAHQDTLRAQTDPLFALFKANQDVAAAQQAVTDAVNTFGEGSPEHVEALANLTESSFDLRDAQAEARVATDLTKDAFINQAVNAGIAYDQAKLLADQLFAMEGLQLDPIRLNVEITELRRAAGSRAGGPLEGTQTGGHIVGPSIVGEAGREIFVPDVPGVVIPHTQTEAVLDALVGPTFAPTVNISLSGGATVRDARLVGAEVEAALRRVAAGRTVR